MFFSVQLLLAKVVKSNEFKEAYKIEAQGMQESMIFFQCSYLQSKNLGIMCYTKLKTDNCTLLVETDNRQFVKH